MDGSHTEDPPENGKEQAYPTVEVEGQMPVIPKMHAGQPLIEERHGILRPGCRQSGTQKQ